MNSIIATYWLVGRGIVEQEQRQCVQLSLLENPVNGASDSARASCRIRAPSVGGACRATADAIGVPTTGLRG